MTNRKVLTLDELMLAKPLFDMCGHDLEKAKATLDAVLALQFAAPIQPQRAEEAEPTLPQPVWYGVIEAPEPEDEAEPVYDPTALWEEAEKRRAARLQVEAELSAAVSNDREEAERLYFGIRMAQPWTAVMQPHQGTVEEFVWDQIRAMDDYMLARLINLAALVTEQEPQAEESYGDPTDVGPGIDDAAACVACNAQEPTGG